MLQFFRDEFAHPVPGIVIFAGLGIWVLATVWCIVGGVLSLYTSLTFMTVGLLAALAGAFGTFVLLTGGVWYGALIAVTFWSARRETDNPS
jgi:membrane protein DedA with SNARE-associated domain